MRKLSFLAGLVLLAACQTPTPIQTAEPEYTATQFPTAPTETATSQPTATVAPSETPTTTPTETAFTEPIDLMLQPLMDGTAPEMNNRIDPGEWDEAMQTELSNGETLHWMYIDGILYLAIQDTVAGAVNFAIEREPGEIWILHASAALSAMIYEESGESWIKTKDWDWCCRSFSDTAPIDALYEAEGWRSMNTRAGTPGIAEFMIKLPPGEYNMAIVIYRTDSGNRFAWFPARMSETAYGQLKENFPDEVDFLLEEWVTLVIE